MATTGIVASPLAWITDPFDPGGAVVTCGTRRSGPSQRHVDGEVRDFVGNASQIVSFGTGGGSVPIVFAALTQAQVAQLDAWMGQTLLLRTKDGQRYYGGYFADGLTTYLTAGPLYDLEVEFLVTSYSDTV